MKLKPLISKLICFQKYRILLFFLVGIAVLTVVSRAADSFMIPQVSIASPEEMKLKYPLEIEGRIMPKRSRGVYCQENLRIAHVNVRADDIVKKGDLLFSIDSKNLQAAIQQTAQEMQKLDLQIKDLEQSWHSQSSKHALALNRAKEDYDDISNISEASVNAAYQEWENAKNEFALHDSRKPNQSASDSSQNDPSLRDISNSDASQENPMDAWAQKRAELEQLCQEKEKQYQDALAAKHNDLKTAARQIEDASQPLAKDHSAALLQIEKADLAHTLEELQKLSQAGGSIYSEYDGQVLECSISTGSLVSSDPVIILGDFSQPFQFEGVVSDAGEQLPIVTGTEGTLKMQKDAAMLEHVKITSISREEEEKFRITADLDSYEISTAQEAVFHVERESRTYPCCIPLSSLYSRTSGDFVIKIQETSTILGRQATAEYVPITCLEKNGQYAAVEGNLSSQDFIIVDASKTIKEGDRIRIAEEENTYEPQKNN